MSANERRPDLKIVVNDPRATATCEIADPHLPIKSGTDVWPDLPPREWLSSLFTKQAVDDVDRAGLDSRRS